MYLDNDGMPLDEGTCDLYCLLGCGGDAKKNREVQNVNKTTFTV
jgi:hypothetical protein